MKLTEVANSRGQQVLRFNDYMGRLAMSDDEKIVANSHRYRKLGVAFFKDGFTWDGDNTTFYKLPEEGGVWEFVIPSWNQDYQLQQGYVECHCSFDERGSIMRFQKTLSLSEIEMWTFPTLKGFMMKAARPV